MKERNKEYNRIKHIIDRTRKKDQMMTEENLAIQKTGEREK